MERRASGSLTPGELRKRAEGRLRETREQSTSKRPDEHDLPALVQELQVHQIELEMQNEALKQARDEAEATAERYFDFYEFAPVGHFTLDGEGGIDTVNLAGAALLGVPRKPLAGRRLALFLAPESRPAFADFLAGVFAGQLGRTCDVTVHREGGGSAHVHLAGEAIRALPVCRVTMVDVSERRRVEDELKANEEKFRRIVETAHEGIWQIDAESRTTFVNPRMAEMLGYEPEEMAGRSLFGFMTDEARVEAGRNLERGRQGIAEEHEFRFLRKDGSEIWTHISTSPLSSGGESYAGAIAMVTDITEHRSAEEALRQSEERFRNLFHRHSAVMLLVEPGSGRIIDANDAAARLYGYDRTTLRSMHIGEINLLPAAQVAAERTRALEEKRSYFVFPHRLASGEERTVEVHSSPIASQQGNVLFSVIHDITERRRAEEALRASEAEVRRLNAELERHIEETISQRDCAEAERDYAEEQLRRLNEQLERRVEERTAELEAANREMEAFSFSVSHDLRAPLWAIAGFARTIVEDYGHLLGADGEHRLDLVRSSVQRMVQLVDDLLAFSRVGRAEMRRSRLKMGDLARSAFEEVLSDCSERRRRIDFSVGELPEASGDPALIRQLWINLLSNAVKFSATAESPDILVEAKLVGGEVVYSVRDNGVGFEMTDVGKLFGVFQRLHSETDFPGNGIGLSLVRRIVERHGGRVRAEGEVGKGATFRFTLGPASA